MTNKFFIVGTGRCGTNLLRDMLILHSDVNVIVESHFLPVLYDLYGLSLITFEQYYSVIENHFSVHGVEWIKIILDIEKKSFDNFKRSFSSFCADLSEGTIVDYTDRLHRFIYGKGEYWVGDKTPEYGVVMSDLKKLWPQAKFIHMVRDGVYVSRSMTRHPGFIRFINEQLSPSDWARSKYKGKILNLADKPVTLQEAARFWKLITDEILAQAQLLNSNDYCEIRYEDLVRKPRKTLEGIAKFLGISCPRKWIAQASLLPRPFTLLRNSISETEYKAVDIEVQALNQSLGYSSNMARYYFDDGTLIPEILRSTRFALKQYYKNIRIKVNQLGKY